MALLPSNTDYTSNDFASLRTRLFALVRSVFPEWTDESVANFGNILVELHAFVGDVLSYYLDNRTRERFITQATLRKSLLGLVKLVGYSPRGASAATVSETFTLASASAGTVTIPKGTRILTADVTQPIAYQLLADLVFEAGETSKNADIENSESASVVFNSSGLANQSVILSKTPFIDDSASVSATNGTFEQVDDFLDSSATDKHFVVSVDQNDKATITFGNGINGLIPSGAIAIEYKFGGGASGIVEAGTLTRLEGNFYDSLGTLARISCTNALRSSGGEDRESNAMIAINAPRSLRLLERCVAREDYEIAALTVSGVARALHLTSNEYGVGENQGILFIVPSGRGTASSTLLAEVAGLYEANGAYPKTNTYDLTVQTAVYVTINVTTTIYLKPGVVASDVKSAITSALNEFFALTVEDSNGEEIPNSSMDFGLNMVDENGDPINSVAWSDIFNVIRDTVGVKKVDANTGLLLNGNRSDVEIDVHGFPALGTITIINGLTGETL